MRGYTWATALLAAVLMLAGTPPAPGEDEQAAKSAFHSRCSSCHDSTAASASSRQEAAGLACVRCHTRHVQAEAGGSTSGPAGHPRPTDSSGAEPARWQDGRCLVCHDPHESSSRHLLRDTSPPVRHGADGSPLDPASRLCLGCHPSHGDWGQRSGYRRHPVGARVEDGRMDPDARITLPLAESAGSATAGAVSCRTCHDVHGSRHVNLLRWNREEIVEACTTCHPKDPARHRPAPERARLGGGS
jgi:predicted CXXCH cytochrome family protein